MKVTVVVEFNCPDDTPTHGVEGIVSDCLSDRLPAEFGFRIMETVPAAYGPQGVSLLVWSQSLGKIT